MVDLPNSSGPGTGYFEGLMTVGELIKKLSEFDSEKEVVIQKDDNGWYGTDTVTEEPGEDDDTLISINWVL